MDMFGVARVLYADGMLLVSETLAIAELHERVRWDREDLQEDLLDLKIAVIEGNFGELPELMDEVNRMILAMRITIREIVDGGEDI